MEGWMARIKEEDSGLNEKITSKDRWARGHLTELSWEEIEIC